ADLEITVKDSGPGIDRSFLPHVFEPFRRAESINTRTVGGLGLGLAIVRHIVEAHGGTVSADSDGPGSGSVFVVRIPTARAARCVCGRLRRAPRQAARTARPRGCVDEGPSRQKIGVDRVVPSSRRSSWAITSGAHGLISTFAMPACVKRSGWSRYSEWPVTAR